MLVGLLTTVFVFLCVFLILLVLIQRGKGSMGLGTIGGGTQMLFGGSGGQDLFQKVTWGLGAIFMGGSLIIALMQTKEHKGSVIFDRYRGATQPVLPSHAPASKNNMQPDIPDNVGKSVEK